MTDDDLWQVDGEADLLARAQEVPEGEPVEGEAERPAAEVVPVEEESVAPPSAEHIIEAILFVAGEAINAEWAAGVIRGLSEGEFESAVTAIARRYRRQGRPYNVRRENGGYRLHLASRYRPVRDRLNGPAREARLAQSALDVLSLIAYRQPVGRSEVEALRGADCSAVVRQLVRLGLVAAARRPASRDEEPLYGTTPRFLNLFQIGSLDDLPRMGEA